VLDDATASAISSAEAARVRKVAVLARVPSV
jgi:hypothetical protein